MKYLIIIICLLTGCTEEEPTAREDKQEAFWASGPVMLGDVAVYANDYDIPPQAGQWLEDVKDCLGMETNQKIIGVEIVYDVDTSILEWEYNDAEGDQAGYFMMDGEKDGFIILETAFIADSYPWKHEFIHFVLWDNGIRDDSIHVEHKSDYWNCEV